MRKSADKLYELQPRVRKSIIVSNPVSKFFLNSFHIPVFSLLR